VRACLSIALALLIGCAAAKPGDGADGGASAASSADGGTAVPQAKGADCITEPSTGAQLCTMISVCPKIVVDHDVFPNCGFRIRGNALDIECACNGYLCPLGTPSTCDQAVKVLSLQTELQVCQQIHEGRCVAGTPTPSPASGTCDKACAAECAGNPGCYRLCGC